MSRRFSERILDFMRRPDYEPMRAQKLSRAMGIAEAEVGDFHDAVDALRRLGRVVLGTNNAVSLPHPPGQVVGTFRANPRGFGFVVPDEQTTHGDLYIPQGETRDALTGDRVLCTVQRRGKRDGKDAFGGRIMKVIERANSRFVGRLCNDGALWYVESDGNTMHAPILIGDPGAKSAVAGDQVVVEIISYPSEGEPARGVIVERLGARGDSGVDLDSIVRQFHLPDQFPDAALAESRAAARTLDEAAASAGREDLSGLTIITIDPDDARDYDDAISLERISGVSDAAVANGGRSRGAAGGRSVGPAVWELGVHIADVSAFVTPDSELDREARKRGTSVYLPGKVIPMLPEALSNGVCSLQEGVARLCKSAFIRYDARGRVVSARFANTVIRSAKRLTYAQATSILSGERGAFPRQAVELVGRMDKLARIIQSRRQAEGMIVLELPSVDLVMDADGRVIDARPEDTSFSHTIIEMFMVEANEAAARLLSAAGVPFLRRIHPDPDEDSIESMGKFLRATGLKLPKQIMPRDLQAVLEKLHGKPEGYAVNLAVLKSMQMAEYSPKEIGHFALASENYAHFTSPIRRYPDLMVHRLIDLQLAGALRKGGKRREPPVGGVVSFEELLEHGRQLSYLSRRAESAERELKAVKVLTLLERQLGETFEGVVTGVTNFGMFVQHPTYLLDGLLRIEDLGDDWWEVDVKLGRIVGERSRATYTLGSRLTVQIAAVNIGQRQLELGLPGKALKKRSAPAKPTGARSSGDRQGQSGRGGRAGEARGGPAGRGGAAGRTGESRGAGGRGGARRGGSGGGARPPAKAGASRGPRKRRRR